MRSAPSLQRSAAVEAGGSSAHAPRVSGDATTVVSSGLLNISEARAFLGGMSRSWLYNAMERGELAFVRVGRSRKIPKNALVVFAAARLHGGWVAGSDGMS